MYEESNTASALCQPPALTAGGIVDEIALLYLHATAPAAPLSCATARRAGAPELPLTPAGKKEKTPRKPVAPAPRASLLVNKSTLPQSTPAEPETLVTIEEMQKRAVASLKSSLDRERRNAVAKEGLKGKTDISRRFAIRHDLQKAIYNHNLRRDGNTGLAVCGCSPTPRFINNSNDRVAVSKFETVNASTGEVTNDYRYVGLMSCGGSMRCPVCAAKIRYVRRNEVAQGVEFLVGQQGYSFLFVTFSVPHSVDTDPRSVVLAMSAARHSLEKSVSWRKFVKEYSYQGMITAAEVTTDAPWATSPTGTHYHFHFVIFLDTRISELEEDKDYIHNLLSKAWTNECKKHSLITENQEKAHLQHGTDIQLPKNKSLQELKSLKFNAEAVCNYVLKEVSFEISPPPATKTGRRDDRISQWQLMYLCTTTHPELYQQLDDILYAVKGRSALRWSRGLREKCGITVVSDKKAVEIAESEEFEPVMLPAAPASTAAVVEIATIGMDDDPASDAAEDEKNTKEDKDLMQGQKGEILSTVDATRWNYIRFYGAQRILLQYLNDLAKVETVTEAILNAAVEKISAGWHPGTGTRLSAKYPRRWLDEEQLKIKDVTKQENFATATRRRLGFV